LWLNILPQRAQRFYKERKVYDVVLKTNILSLPGQGFPLLTVFPVAVSCSLADAAVAITARPPPETRIQAGTERSAVTGFSDG